jgi:hypothetical protein
VFGENADCERVVAGNRLSDCDMPNLQLPSLTRAA